MKPGQTMAEIERRRTLAIGEADRVLGTVWDALQGVAQRHEQMDEAAALRLQGEIRRARGDLAEWRPESV